MDILFVSHSAGLYGAERSLLSVVGRLKHRGHQVTVVIPQAGPLRQQLEEVDVHVIRWNYYGWIGRKGQLIKGSYRLLFNLVSAVAFVVGKKPTQHVVYTNTVTTNFGLLVALLTKKKHVWHVREFVHEDMGARFDFPFLLLRRFFLKNLGLAIYNSRSLHRKFIAFFGEHNSKVIYNGIRLTDTQDRFRVRPIDEFSRLSLLMMSSLHSGKGHVDAINALVSISKACPGVRLNIVGDGDEKYLSMLRNMADGLGIGDKVRFLGYIEDSSKVMRDCDIFLMCSRSEAFGRVTVEAMSVGCPVVGARSGGTAEIIEEGVSGELYEPGNAKALADKLLFLIEDPQARESLSTNAIARSRYFTEDRCVDKIERSLETL